MASFVIACKKFFGTKILTKEEAEMSKYTKQQKLDWLQKALDRPCLLQVNHPHLAWYPTKEDQEIYNEIKKDIESNNSE